MADEKGAHGEEFRDLIATMETQRQLGQDANDAWWQNQEAMEERSSQPAGFFAEADAKLHDGKRDIRDIQERMRNQVQDIVENMRETVDEQTPEYKAYMTQRAAEDARFERAMAYMESNQYLEDQGEIVEQRWMAHETWLASGGKEGEPHHQFLEGQQPEEALRTYREEQDWRQEGYAQQEIDRSAADEAAQEERIDAAQERQGAQEPDAGQVQRWEFTHTLADTLRARAEAYHQEHGESVGATAKRVVQEQSEGYGR